MDFKFSKSSKKIYYAAITLYFITAHIILPSLNKNDFLIFSSWSLFSSTNKMAKDISWNEGKTFLFRDHRTNGRKSINLYHTIFHKVQNNDLKWLNKNLNIITNFCHCKNIKVFTLNGQLYEHIILKKNLKVKKMTLLEKTI